MCVEEEEDDEGDGEEDDDADAILAEDQENLRINAGFDMEGEPSCDNGVEFSESFGADDDEEAGAKLAANARASKIERGRRCDTIDD